MIKEFLAFAIRLLGLPLLIRELLCRHRVTILMYHNPKPATLARHLRHLSRQYHFISLNQLVEAIHNRDWSRIPPKSLVITFDDGHVGNYELLALFKAYKICPTIYLCTQIVNTNRHFWFKGERIQGGRFKKQREFLKKLSHAERLATLKREYHFEPHKELPDRQALNRTELSEMMAHSDFQGHTQFHPVLTTCTDEECYREVEGCKQDLEALLDTRCDHFSYPNGDYTGREIDMVKRCGYQSARTSDAGWNGINTDPYRLKAMDIGDDASVNQLIAQVCGAFQFLKYARWGRLDGSHPTIKIRPMNR